MVTRGIKQGDLVKCDVRGQVFYAEVVALGDKIPPDPKFGGSGDYGGEGNFAPKPGKVTSIQIMPLSKTITYRTVKPRQIIGHYRRAKGSQ